MLNTDPVSRITIKQIMEHPWYKAHIPLHLKYTEAVVDQNQILDCIGSVQANRSKKEIFEEVLEKCLEYPEFEGLCKNKVELKERILKKKQDPFTVTYAILLDSTLKVKRKVLIKSLRQARRQLLVLISTSPLASPVSPLHEIAKTLLYMHIEYVSSFL
ncbi:unnamed protein product [Blepharisma stoltei]|uniref:Uncharacterized protein n=1 Tax=Blepharisma stoltei TaxID=1481888 RepID=A0AAU9IXE9_9CILI|nr:unnamed protein product [Blepharisma stoltei]